MNAPKDGPVQATERTIAALAARSDAMRSLLARLVGINSHSANAAGVNAVGNLLVEALAPLPLQLAVQVDREGVRHLSFATAAADREASVLLIGHHDTVFPPGEFDGFSIEGELARGPGALDMKGGLAMVITVLGALHEAGLLERFPLRFVSVGDEEIGSPRSRALLHELAARSRAALVFEAGREGDAIITARRGSGRAKLVVHGQAAHAGNALGEGRNAIWALARYVDRAQAQSGTIPGTSVSVGLIRGGTARNTVPGRAEAEFDLRFTDAPGETALIARLLETARELERSFEGVRLEAEIEVTRKPWSRSEASGALCARYLEAQRAAGLGGSEAPVVGGGSDANTVGALGLPAIDGLGPRGAGFHTRGEYLVLSSLRPKAEALARFLLREFGA